MNNSSRRYFAAVLFVVCPILGAQVIKPSNTVSPNIVCTEVVSASTHTPDELSSQCGGGGGGTGGGGGGTGSIVALNWAGPWIIPTGQLGNVNVGGDGGNSYSRYGAGATVFNNHLYIAFTSRCSSTDCPVYLGWTSNPDSTDPLRYTWVETSFISNNNPALATDGTNMYLAFSQSNGIGYLESTTDGSDWNSRSMYDTNGWGGFGLDTIGHEPTLAYGNNGVLYITYTDNTPYDPYTDYIADLSTLDIAANQYYASNGYQIGANQMNFQPGLAMWNGTLYMAYEDRGNTHCLNGYSITPSLTRSTWTLNKCADQTSVGPNLAVFHNNLYIGFRTNDSDQKLIVRGGSSPDAISYSTEPTDHEQIDGTPVMVDLNQMNPKVDALMFIYSRNGNLYQDFATIQ